MILINGAASTEIAVTDRGFQYGDGLFETVEVLNGQLAFWTEHLQRLKLGCEKLCLPIPDNQLLNAEALQLSRTCKHGVLKIIITRGSGGRGYRLPESVTPTRVLSLHPFPDYPVKFYSAGIQVRFCQQRLGLNPALAGIKHLNRLEQILARAEWDDAQIQEGLMLDLNGFVIEGTMSNLFFVREQKLYTSALNQAGVAGIMRDFVLKTASQLGIESEIGLFTPAQVLSADELFITNAIIGICPISQLQQQTFALGPVTKTLQANLARYKQTLFSDAPFN